MSGHASRKSLDDKDIVLMMSETINPAALKAIIHSKSDLICSMFHLTYNMILNLLQMENINSEYILKKAFLQFQNQNNILLLYNSTEVGTSTH